MGIFNFFKTKKNISNKIQILSNEGIIINDVNLLWNSDRNDIRNLLNLKYKENDTFIDFSTYFDGDSSHNIHQKRDVYKKIFSKNDLVFLIYDKENKLRELEIHSGYRIVLDDIEFRFNRDIKEYLNIFKNKQIIYKEIEEGNYFFEKLKIVIADNEAMGGDGHNLAYFCVSSDVNHLIEGNQ